ncbi:2TM domain-containing protein [uncultured Eudoraea sp.]|uniref:2TM domain-containing protein n=1 Tax=uncultured Eudoraea sp. TaxID=1035614 RepID=UPI00261BC175|nr:2TM domain-containing protein [uncultured Eudoraea sp.]
MENKRIESSYFRAKERVKAIKEFYVSGILYCLVIPILIGINFQTTSFPWAIFPALGWGFGLIVTGMAAKGINPLWGKEWEQRKIQELIENNNF